MITNVQLTKQLNELRPGARITSLTVDQQLKLLDSTIAAERLALDANIDAWERQVDEDYEVLATRQLALNEGFLALAKAEAAKP